MGQGQSADVQEAVDGVEAANNQAPESSGVKLYHYVRAGDAGQWEVASNNARPRLYDRNEDTGNKKSEWYLEVEGSDVDVRADDALQYVVDTVQRRVTFSADGRIWALRFGCPARFKSFLEDFNDKLFYNQFGVDNDEASRAKLLGEDYAGVFFARDAADRGQEPMEVEEEFYDAQGTPEYQREQRAKMAREGDEDDEGEGYSGLVMGAGENNYLLRGKHFDVLRNVAGGVEDKGISFSLATGQGTPAASGRTTRSSAAAASTSQGGYITPSRVMLTNCETKMNLLTPDHPTSMYRADIETQKIVSTWAFNKDGADIPIRDIVHDNKSAQLEETNTFLGLDSNRLCRWDMRDPTGVVQDTSKMAYTGGKDYAARTNFTCMATSGDGYVAVGSQDGKVRLYGSTSLQRANTAIPGLGAPITAIDITYDGKWVLATTDRYLMVVKTTYTTEKGTEACGFTSRMGTRGTTPHLLRLKPEDVAHTGSGKFTKGKFMWITEAGLTERWIVANCGKHSVIWNFNRVRGSGTNSLSYGGLPTSMDYILSKKDEEVVDAAFLHSRYANQNANNPQNPGASLVVATQQHLSYMS